MNYAKDEGRKNFKGSNYIKEGIKIIFDEN